METENIISIRKRDKDLAKAAFANFMALTEACLNDKALSSPQTFKSLSAFELEKLSVNCMKEVCSSTPFRADEIKLVSGLTFPDIISETFYGVEVKSTQSDHWKSVGSSIIESTRNPNVESIYMLFGKLGGTPKFICRPYEECLYDITVTHSPRYLIDMQISHDATIFSKMNTTYDTLRKSKDSIAQVRRYYRDLVISENKKEMPWWIEDKSSTDVHTHSDMMIRHISSLSFEEKRKLFSQVYILFPHSMINNQYITPSMWLVAYHKIVCHNMRDFFSAGGQTKYLNNHLLEKPLPAIVGRFLEYSKTIKHIINLYHSEIEIYNPELLKNKDLFYAWVCQVDKLLKIKIGEHVHFVEWVYSDSTLSTDLL